MTTLGRCECGARASFLIQIIVVSASNSVTGERELKGHADTTWAACSKHLGRDVRRAVDKFHSHYNREFLIAPNHIVSVVSEHDLKRSELQR